MIKNLTLHLYWVIAILIGIISVLLWRLPNGSTLSGYISFSASIASLVLAVVAIFQSLLSSRGFEGALTEIQTSARSIMDETSRLGKASLSLSDEAEAAIQKLGNIPDELMIMKGEFSGKFEK